jgi:acetylornithine deacetylase/succinyl-diaminopimelate desuccinylase-like protein
LNTEFVVELLKQLIATPSFSREEDRTAAMLEAFFQERSIQTHRKGNNVWVKNKFFDASKPAILLNSHHDTVRPNPGYTRNPYSPDTEKGKLYGLGSNDAGGPLVALAAAFLHFYERHDLKSNLLLAASAEEEVSGPAGIESIWPDLPKIDCAIVGEPTRMEMAIAEKGLLVLDCTAIGKAGHAAREEGTNAIYKAIEAIAWFQTFQFPRVSEVLGKVKMSVTVIQAGQAHNQVPAECKFTVDIRVTDAYSLEEVLEVVTKNVSCQVKPRSMRLRPSGVSMDHPLVKAAQNLEIKLYGSPTTSDQALIPVPSVKIGPGDSARSHSADEFIYLKEIEEGITTYISLLNELLN